ncbi:DUF1540 domain-containing protein [Halobacillus sp. ACCC02827]|uniref:DUF1540 domain-containing protein n=1 Tax=Bacillaceae TaxID=186817 RepID=UPI0002A4FF7B|nr:MULTISPECIES: DUF1540 domain-containing protein [Bacillaceae]ELK47744.1 hypothetical protein D479_05250 [Halobacillus sp. BAB-2008]QHT45427.1 DUF1540 domain-containing protein [Bacillus sp. SB49]WJE16222.1 DUF1540 domain-containing protein [Halobacillus sp. ACCC02827]
MAMDVLCDVKNCVHNEDGQKCGAETIFIISESGKTASSQNETDCKTFEAKH